MTCFLSALEHDFGFAFCPPLSVILCLLLSALERDFCVGSFGGLKLRYPHPCRGSSTFLHLGPPLTHHDRITRPRMDPADPNSLRQAMASHGHLLGQHEQYFRELKEAVSTLTAQIGSLTLQVERRSESTAAEDLRPAGTSSVLPASRSAGNFVLWEPNIPHPPRYSGEIGGCDQFIHQCSLVLDQQPHTLPDDGAKVAFIMSLLSGQAALWAMAVSKANPELRASVPAFLAEFRNVFDHPVKGKEAGSRLLDLRGGILHLLPGFGRREPLRRSARDFPAGTQPADQGRAGGTGRDVHSGGAHRLGHPVGQEVAGATAGTGEGATTGGNGHGSGNGRRSDDRRQRTRLLSRYRPRPPTLRGDALLPEMASSLCSWEEGGYRPSVGGGLRDVGTSHPFQPQPFHPNVTSSLSTPSPWDQLTQKDYNCQEK
ncbi:uncharacterized protein LOC144060680 [Vanacampus margaritifer]